MKEDITVIKVEHIGKKYIIKHRNSQNLKTQAGKLTGRFFKPITRQATEDFWALKDISFDIKRGERVGIIGKNGAGKSTLLKLLSRITEPTVGRIELLGKISAMLEVGTGFNPELTGRENVYLNGAILGMSKKEIDDKFDRIVEFSEIGNFIDTPVKRYSSGMYVRLAFAVASHLDPDILIIDEVLAVGDQKFRQKCMIRMNEIADSDRTILCVSHQMNVIRELCDRVIVLEKGMLVFDGDVEIGIKQYLSDRIADHSDLIDLKSRKRPDVWSGYPLFLEHIEFLNAVQRLDGEDSQLRFKIKWSAKKNINGVKLRMIIKFNDDTPIGTAFSGMLANAEEGMSYSNILSFDTSSLFPGNYSVTLSLFESDSSGGTVYLDYISDAFSFDVVELKNEKRSKEYTNSNWGQVRLPDIKLLLNLRSEPPA